MQKEEDSKGHRLNNHTKSQKTKWNGEKQLLQHSEDFQQESKIYLSLRKILLS